MPRGDDDPLHARDAILAAAASGDTRHALELAPPDELAATEQLLADAVASGASAVGLDELRDRLPWTIRSPGLIVAGGRSHHARDGR